MHTSGLSGPSVNLSQQSPNEWVWTSGSKHVCCEHHVKTLQGRRENGPAEDTDIGVSNLVGGTVASSYVCFARDCTCIVIVMLENL